MANSRARRWKRRRRRRHLNGWFNRRWKARLDRAYMALWMGGLGYHLAANEETSLVWNEVPPTFA